MTFNPWVGQELAVGELGYCVAEHPAAPGIPYAQQGRKGTVYQLLGQGTPHALKVLLSRFRQPSLVTISDRIAPLTALPGLHAASRSVLTPRRDRELLRQLPDLTYAVLMPWIAGPTWFEILSDGRALSEGECHRLAMHLLVALNGMEERGIAHCDLSGTNLIIPFFSPSEAGRLHPVEFVDLEDLFAPGMDRPDTLPCGSPGYAHHTSASGLWSRDADRFAGAVLLGECLAWCDPGVRSAAWGESYFAPTEIHEETNRYLVLLHALERRWGRKAAALFEQAWRSDQLRECPTFGEWAVALADGRPVDAFVAKPAEHSRDLDQYRRMRQGLAPDSALARELDLILTESVVAEPPSGAGAAESTGRDDVSPVLGREQQAGTGAPHSATMVGAIVPAGDVRIPSARRIPRVFLVKQQWYWVTAALCAIAFLAMYGAKAANSPSRLVLNLVDALNNLDANRVIAAAGIDVTSDFPFEAPVPGDSTGNIRFYWQVRERFILYTDLYHRCEQCDWPYAPTPVMDVKVVAEVVDKVTDRAYVVAHVVSQDIQLNTVNERVVIILEKQKGRWSVRTTTPCSYHRENVDVVNACRVNT